MAFAGNCGVLLDISDRSIAGETTLQALFHEELGLVIEVASSNVQQVVSAYTEAGVSCVRIGAPCPLDKVTIVGKSGEVEFEATMTDLRDTWESTSFVLEALQANPACVEQERIGMSTRRTPIVKATIPEPKTQPPS